MGKIVVAKKYRLGMDGDKYSKQFKTTLRERVIIDEDYVNQTNATTQISGIMYEIDEKATAERDERLQPKKAANPNAELVEFLESLSPEELKQYAIDAGITEKEIGTKKENGIIRLILSKK